MAQPFIGQILSVAFQFTPANYIACNGQLLSISEYETLFTLLGTTYGGDGVNTFGVPDLRSRTPVHMGSGAYGTYLLGQVGGQENVPLTTNQLPLHTHGVTVQTDPGSQPTPAGNYLAGSSDAQYTATPNSATGTMLNPVGASSAHSNIQPTLCINYIISPYGIYPSQN